MCSLFCTYSLFQDFYSDDAHHANYGKNSSNRHFQHGAQSVYKIYSVLKLFDFAICSAHFDFFEITTPVMRIMLTMANIVQIIISDMAHTVYLRFTVFFKLFDFAICCAHFHFFEITSAVMRIILTMANIVQISISDMAQTVYIRFKVFWTSSILQFVLHILTFSKLLLRRFASC